MNKQLIQKARQRYIIPSGASYQYRTLNAIHIAPNNTIRHEMSKSLGAYMLRKRVIPGEPEMKGTKMKGVELK